MLASWIAPHQRIKRKSIAGHTRTLLHKILAAFWSLDPHLFGKLLGLRAFASLHPGCLGLGVLAALDPQRDSFTLGATWLAAVLATGTVVGDLWVGERALGPSRSLKVDQGTENWIRVEIVSVGMPLRHEYRMWRLMLWTPFVLLLASFGHQVDVTGSEGRLRCLLLVRSHHDFNLPATTIGHIGVLRVDGPRLRIRMYVHLNLMIFGFVKLKFNYFLF